MKIKLAAAEAHFIWIEETQRFIYRQEPQPDIQLRAALPPAPVSPTQSREPDFPPPGEPTHSLMSHLILSGENVQHPLTQNAFSSVKNQLSISSGVRSFNEYLLSLCCAQD